jgi:hypothetical protein
VTIGVPAASGNLDKAIIRRYIRTRLTDVTECYENALLSKPSLEGTVTVKFTIEAAGLVGTSTASGLDPAVDSCVAAAIKKIVFPKPLGGGKVNVSYPFVFRPASSKPS